MTNGVREALAGRDRLRRRGCGLCGVIGGVAGT